MIKKDKIILLVYVILGLSYLLFILDSANDLSGEIISILPKKITYFEVISIVDVDRTLIFNLITNVDIYPNVLPENIVYVNVLNRTSNQVIAEEEFKEAGIKSKLIAKHMINSYNEHIIEIIDGDAKGTIITQLFEDYESKTKITTKVVLNVNGISSLIHYLPESNMIHATNTVISKFVEYAKRDTFENNVNALYLEILNRPADSEGLKHFSSLLRSGELSVDELRTTLLNSPEKTSMDLKTIDELTNETKNTIDDIYEKILLRKADPKGMQYFGNILENGTSISEIRNALLYSNEGQNVSIQHPIRMEIKHLLETLYNRPATYEEINYYHELIDDKKIKLSELENELKQSKEYSGN